MLPFAVGAKARQFLGFPRYSPATQLTQAQFSCGVARTLLTAARFQGISICQDDILQLSLVRKMPAQRGLFRF
jgi:hypothetical protein